METEVLLLLYIVRELMGGFFFFFPETSDLQGKLSVLIESF